MQEYKGAVDFISNLIDTLNKDDIDLPVYDADLAKLSKKLGHNGYTFLQINDGTNIEIVRAEYGAGGISITRGVEQTEPTSFPEGSEVKWLITPTAVEDIICQMECCPGVNDESVAVAFR